MQENHWRELSLQGIEKFKLILHALNTFYSKIKLHQDTELTYFKTRLVTEENVRILINKVGNTLKGYDPYTFLIYATMNFTGNKIEEENWIHIDGIQIERDELRSNGVLDHPAFDITCITDLYNEYSFPATEDKIPNLKDLI